METSLETREPIRLPVCLFVDGVRGAIKKVLGLPSYVQNKIKIPFAFYSSKAQNTTCII